MIFAALAPQREHFDRPCAWVKGATPKATTALSESASDDRYDHTTEPLIEVISRVHSGRCSIL
jgi:hypothetical protein